MKYILFDPFYKIKYLKSLFQIMFKLVLHSVSHTLVLFLRRNPALRCFCDPVIQVFLGCGGGALKQFRTSILGTSSSSCFSKRKEKKELNTVSQ